MSQNNKNKNKKKSLPSARCVVFSALSLSLLLVLSLLTLGPHLGLGLGLGLGVEATEEATEGVFAEREKAVLSLAGGGFLAHACYSGLLAALQANRNRNRNSTLRAPAPAGLGRRPGLLGLSGFDALSSVSGGSWFASQLLFSSDFLQLLQRMAAEPEAAGQLYADRWMDPWLQVIDAETARDNSWETRWLERLAELSPRLSRVLALQDARTLAFFLQSGLTWRHFVEVLLATTSPDLRWGNGTAQWAEGKAWLVGTAMATPPDKSKMARLWEADAGLDHAGYYAANASAVFTPARFSVALGGGQGQGQGQELLPFCAAAGCEELAFTYVGSRNAGLTTFRARALGGGAPLRGKAALPLIPVVAASSAFVGGACTAKDLEVALEALGGELAVWSASPSASDAEDDIFEAGEKLVEKIRSADEATRAAVDSLATGRLRALVDGSYVDNTGISHAVAFGADRVVAFMVNSRLSEPLADGSWYDAGDVLNMFSGAPTHVTDAGLDFYFLNVFRETKEEATRRYAALPRLSHVPDSRFLDGVRLGSLGNVSTADCPQLGLQAGRQLSLDVVVFESTLTIGEWVNFHHFPMLVQEIVDAFNNETNRDLVDRFVRESLS